jgi:hypothetical protein
MDLEGLDKTFKDFGINYTFLSSVRIVNERSFEQVSFGRYYICFTI